MIELNGYIMFHGDLTYKQRDSDNVVTIVNENFLFRPDTDCWYSENTIIKSDNFISYFEYEEDKTKCNGVQIAFDGTKIDPCSYQVIEEYDNCHVEILRCKKCGHIEIGWSRKND